MIILNKKRIILFILIIFISLIIYFMCLDKNTSNILIKEVSSNIDINGKTVILDPGHRSTRLWGSE